MHRCLLQEEKGGRHFRKLGYADLNLSWYAGAGPTTQRYILHPYDRSHRLDNSIVRVSVNVTLREGDTIFRRPVARQQHPVTIEEGGRSKKEEDKSEREQSSSGGGGGGGDGAQSQSRPSSLTAFQQRLSGRLL